MKSFASKFIWCSLVLSGIPFLHPLTEIIRDLQRDARLKNGFLLPILHIKKH